MKALFTNLLLLGIVCAGTAAADDAKKLRLITWADYAPPEVVALFKQETGIQVEVTLSNNEEIISKLRATGGAGYDLAQPSQDRITGMQSEFGIYKPIDLSKVKLDQFRPEILEITRRNATVRALGWLILLRVSGVLPALLVKLGITAEPVELLYHDATILVGLIYTSMLFMVVPLVSSLESLDNALARGRKPGAQCRKPVPDAGLGAARPDAHARRQARAVTVTRLQRRARRTPDFWRACSSYSTGRTPRATALIRA